MTSISTKSTLLKIVNQYINNKQLARRHERSNDTMTVRHSLVYGQAKERVRTKKGEENSYKQAKATNPERHLTWANRNCVNLFIE